MPTTERRRTSARRESLLGDQPGAFASARYVRITPMKARRVDPTWSAACRSTTPCPCCSSRRSPRPQTVYKVLESAVANAETTEDLDRADLVVSSARSTRARR